MVSWSEHPSAWGMSRPTLPASAMPGNNQHEPWHRHEAAARWTSTEAVSLKPTVFISRVQLDLDCSLDIRPYGSCLYVFLQRGNNLFWFSQWILLVAPTDNRYSIHLAYSAARGV